MSTNTIELPWGAGRLAAPLAGRDLSKARVVVVTDDHSRPTPVRDFLPAVLDQLAAAGAEQERIEILLANGVHRASTPREVAEKLGPEPAGRFRWRCHNASAPAELAQLVRWVAARVPRRATAWVFPYGGATYATL